MGELIEDGQGGVLRSKPECKKSEDCKKSPNCTCPVCKCNHYRICECVDSVN